MTIEDVTAPHPTAGDAAALVASRICHDLVNPVGALASAVDLLGDPASDAETRSDALDLLRTSVDKAVGLLKFARFAYGAGLSGPGTAVRDEARAALDGAFAAARADLQWTLPPGDMPRSAARALLAAAAAAADCVPRGGTVRIEETGDGFSVTAAGPRVFLTAETLDAVAGRRDGLAPKQAPLYLAAEALRAAGGEVAVRRDDDPAAQVVFSIRAAPVTVAAGGASA